MARTPKRLRATVWMAAPVLILLSLDAPGAATPGRLTFEERLAAREAIERVRYATQKGATLPFEEAYPPELLRRKVRETLDLSEALAREWRRPVTPEMLEAERRRIQRETRFPGRLAAIEAALGHDQVLIREVFIRAGLVRRLVQSWSAASAERDPEQEAPALPGRAGGSPLSAAGFSGRDAREVVEILGRGFPEGPAPAGAGPREETMLRASRAGQVRGAAAPEAGTACLPDDQWTPSLTPVPGPSAWLTMWTGDRMIVVGGREPGGLYDPLTDTWERLPLAGGRGAWITSAVWTGTEAIAGTILQDSPPRGITGARLDPSTRTWEPISMEGAPTAWFPPPPIWTGSEMIMWNYGSSISGPVEGARYDPDADAWSPISTVNAPAGRFHKAIWTGSEMILWGGQRDTGAPGTGARYDPATDTWSPMSTVNAPSARTGHSAVWTGTEMIVWGGRVSPWNGVNDPGLAGDGARYDPATDTWSPMSSMNAPSPRNNALAVWTGAEMILWGGFTTLSPGDGGGRYDPFSDTWTAVTDSGAPPPLDAGQAVWTGSEMIIWGKTSTDPVHRTVGGRYDPVTDSWVPVNSTLYPPLGDVAGVWTGNELLVWNGSSRSGTRHRFDPLTSAWLLMSDIGAPESREAHSAVWTGDAMIVWGGSKKWYDADGVMRSGGIYHPISDTWTGTLGGGNAPSPRMEHWAFWTGSRMLVWGGFDRSGDDLDSGGLYDPRTNTWTATSLEGAADPRNRRGGGAVWTGSEMLVWGGMVRDGGSETPARGGGRYDPASDIWRPMAVAPFHRSEHSSTWTGREMIAWGGREDPNSLGSNTGARYDPETDSWSLVSTANAPFARFRHISLWTGREMIIWGGLGCVPEGEPDCSSWITHGGARYDPEHDLWTPMSTTQEPSWITRPALAAWTGQEMIIHQNLSGWRVGGRYALGGGTDNDGDGLSECDGDCHDADPSVYPGAQEACDGLDNDCDGLTDNVPGRADLAPATFNTGSRGESFSSTLSLAAVCGSTLPAEAGLVQAAWISRVGSTAFPDPASVACPNPAGGTGFERGIVAGDVRPAGDGSGVTLRFSRPSDGDCATLDGGRQELLRLLAAYPGGSDVTICVTARAGSRPIEACGTARVAGPGGR